MTVHSATQEDPSIPTVRARKLASFGELGDREHGRGKMMSPPPEGERSMLARKPRNRGISCLGLSIGRKAAGEETAGRCNQRETVSRQFATLHSPPLAPRRLGGVGEEGDGRRGSGERGGSSSPIWLYQYRHMYIYNLQFCERAASITASALCRKP